MERAQPVFFISLYSLAKSVNSKTQLQALVWNLIDIAKRQKDAGLSDSLKWAFDKTPCAECRHRLIIQLDALNKFKGIILDECQFDANEDISTLAKRKSAESK